MCTLCLVSAFRVWLFGGRFPVAPSSYINPFSAVYRQIIIFLFGTIFRHVALLVTEILRQDQNFQNIPRKFISY